MKRRVTKRKTLKGKGYVIENKGPNSQALRRYQGNPFLSGSDEIKLPVKLPAKPITTMPVRNGMAIRQQQKGEGFVEDAYEGVKKGVKKVYNWIADKFLPNDLPANFKSRLQKYGDYLITDITIGRDPVSSVIQRLLNVLTLGKYDMMKRKLYYDDVFHLYALITAKRGAQTVRLRLEKNNVVVLKESADRPVEYINVSLGGKYITVGEYIGKGIAKMGKTEFVRYDAIKNNCQRFQTELLQANGLMTAEADKFINQDVRQLLSDPAYGFSKVITDLGNVFGHMTGGKKPKVVKVVKQVKQIKPVNVKPSQQVGGCGECQKGSGLIRF